MQKAFESRGLKPHGAERAGSDVIKTYVELGLGSASSKMAFDPKRDITLRAMDASHLFESSTTRLGIKRGAYLRRYAYDFIEMFAPHLARDTVERAGRRRLALRRAEGERNRGRPDFLGIWSDPDSLDPDLPECSAMKSRTRGSPSAPPREDAVVPDPSDEVLAHLARDVEAQARARPRSGRCPRCRRAPFDREERGVADRLRPHQLAHERGPLGSA